MTMTDSTLRPTSFIDYVGQAEAKDELRVHIAAARKSKRPLGHVLLTGGGGQGKTSFAAAIAGEVGDPFKIIQMPLKPADYRTLRMHDGVILLDELHLATKEQTFEIMELLWEGHVRTAAGLLIEPCWLTIIGATTEEGDLFKPLLQRFDHHPHLDEYTLDEMTAIIQVLADKAEIDLDEETAAALGRASGFVPRKARSLVLTARDLQELGLPITATEILRLKRIEHDGLDRQHLSYLKLLFDEDAAMGMSTIVTMLDTQVSVIREMDRLLVGQLKLVERTKRGRILTDAGYRRTDELFNQKGRR